MRLKFRAWDSDNNEYFKAGYSKERHGFVWWNIQPNGEFVSGVDDSVDEPPFKARFILEQGTGREDKHGVEIFEGDRVKPFIGSEYVGEFKEHTAGQYGDGIHGFFIKYKCEIVGNIHEKEQENEI